VAGGPPPVGEALLGPVLAVATAGVAWAVERRR
jgi:hypothetical protein